MRCFPALTQKNIPELTAQQESIFEKNIVWLFGSARGGTTWTASQLLSFQTNSINEPHIEEHLGMRAREINERFVRRIDNPQKNSGYFFSDQYKDVWTYYLKKLILHRFYAQTQDIFHKTIIKEVCQFGSADILSACMNNSRIIILLRDGRDIVDSLLDARSKGGWMTERGLYPITQDGSKKENQGFFQTPTRLLYMTNQSEAWVVRNENFLKAYNNHHKELRYMIKYEDLLKNTFDELRNLYNFIDIDISEDKLQKIVTKFSFENMSTEEKGEGKFLRSASPGRWRENFSEDEKKKINKIMRKMLQKLGYNI